MSPPGLAHDVAHISFLFVVIDDTSSGRPPARFRIRPRRNFKISASKTA
jgi:hypothetical protein